LSDDLHWLDLGTVASRIASGALRSRDVLEETLSRIARLDQHLNAYISIFSDRALVAADRADAARKRGDALGPLHGVPIGIKDIFEISGEVMTAGMPSRVAQRATRTATVVRRLEAAGAILIGTQNVAEGVFGEYLPPYGLPVNPWDAGRWAGASSGGSAVAVAAGLCYGAVGSDTGGSIRMPSAVNGATGLKPTWGRVSRHGVFELAATLDHIGPIARNAADAARLFDVIAGLDPDDPTSRNDPVPSLTALLHQGVSGMTVGLDFIWIEEGVHPAVSEAVLDCARLLEQQGARIVPVSLPVLNDVVDIWYDVCAAQTARAHHESFADHANSYSAALSAIIRHGQAMPATILQEAQIRRMDYSGRLIRRLSEVDLVAIPVLPFEPPTLAQTRQMDRALIDALHRFTCPFTLSGAPCITFPGGFTRGGLPLAVQLVAKPLAEPTLVQAAHAFQRTTSFHLACPPELVP